MANQLQSTPALSDYVRDVSLREDDILRDLRIATGGLPMGDAMQVMAEEGQLLNLLVGLTPANAVLEIGTFTGYSTLCMARALAPGGRLVTCDITERWPMIGAQYWQRAEVADRIDVRIGDAATTLTQLISEHGLASFDFVFIDADKANYATYFESALKLVSDDGLIVVDNTLFFGRVIEPEAQDADTVAIREFNVRLRDDQRVSIALIPMADGITLVRKKKAPAAQP